MPDSAVDRLSIKLFGDCASVEQLKLLGEKAMITGYTTNPTLMRKAGVVDYEAFAREAVECADGRPISFEVFADENDEMERQARLIAAWGSNVFVKVPITNTRRVPTTEVQRRLSSDGIALNITALMTVDQVSSVAAAVEGGAPTIVSVFAGRIADTGRDPVPLMAEAVSVLAAAGNCELLWASPRELLNIFQADEVGCDIITATPDVLAKLELVGKDLDQFSLETVQMFFDDAAAAGFVL